MKKILLTLSLAVSAVSFAQINYNEGFEVDNGGFSNVGFFRSKFAVVCQGDYALIRNLYPSATTGATTYSSSNSSGAAIDVSFSYRTFNYALDTNKKVSGEMVVEYSKDDGATYTQASKVDLTELFGCKPYSLKIPEGAVPKGSKFKFRVTGNQKTDGDFYLILDDFKFAQATLGVSDINKSKFSIHPNPVKDILYIDNGNSVEKVIVSDISGRQIKTVKPSENSINVADLKPGNYIVTVIDKDGNQQSSKLIKK